jgi:hypothetical protein
MKDVRTRLGKNVTGKGSKMKILMDLDEFMVEINGD